MDLALLATNMQALLTQIAEPIAWQSGCCQRTSPLAGAGLVQTVVLCCLAHPKPTVEDYAQVAAALDHPVTPQAIDQRFTPSLAQALEKLLAQAVHVVLSRNPATATVLNRFDAVEIQDSSTITLPDCLADYWQGSRTVTGGTAAVKVQTRLDLKSGVLSAVRLEAGRANDHATPLQTAGLVANTLHLRDLGYFDLDVLQAIDAAGAFYLSRVQDGTALFAASGERLNLSLFLGQQPDNVVDVPVTMGVQQRLACRLVAVRLPQEVADRRRQQAHAQGRKKGYTPSQEKLALCAWNYYVSNVPAERLSVEDVLALARARWQIECLFKQWKSDGGLTQVRSSKPWRIVSEVLAKLIALVIEHAVLVQCVWQRANRSLRKAAKAVRRQAGQLIASFGNLSALVQALQAICQSLSKGAKVDRRRKHPSAFQVLSDPKTYGYERLDLA